MRTLVEGAVFTEEIKGSRFIAKAFHVSSSEEAFVFLGYAKEEQATHNCWAYKIEQEYRCFDDGEPNGTAGKPILHAIERQAVDHVVVMVARYFGGTKLGRGGLIRAYGGCAAKCLRRAELMRMHPSMAVRVFVGFDFIGRLHPIISRFGATKLEGTFSEEGLDLKLRIERRNFRPLSETLQNASGGKIVLTEVEADP